jgi:hypothetical protein
MIVILSLLLLLAAPSAAHAATTVTDSATIPAPLAKPLVVQLSIDPPVKGPEPQCAEDGILHLRNGVIKICSGGAWQPVVFSR